MAIEILAGTAILAAAVTSLFVAGAAISSAWSEGASQAERAVDAFLAGAALAMLVVAVLGNAGALWPAWALGACVASGVVGAAVTRGRAPREVAATAAAGLRALRGSPAMWLVVILAAACLARGLSIPQLAWDGLTYHTTYPATWLHEGGFVRVEGDGTWELYEGFPKGFESLVYLGFAALRHDHVVNLVNLPFWIAAGAGMRATLGTCGVRGHERDVWVLLGLACPVLLAYVTPAYVEVPTAACFAAATSAASAAIVRREPRRLLSLGLALGVGLSLKLTMLSWVAFAIVPMLVCARQAGARATWKWALGALLLAAAISAPWYLRNVAICGNPIYPSGLPGFTEGPRAGTLLNRWGLGDTSVVGLAETFEVGEHVLALPWKVRYPLGPGWLFVLSFAGALGLPLFVRDKERRALASSFTLLTIVLVGVYLLTPYNGLYPEADTRFLGTALLAAIFASAGALGTLGERARLSWLAASVVLVVLSLVRTQLVWSSPTPWAVALSAAVTIAVAGAAVAATSSGRRVVGRGLAALGVAAALVLWIPVLRARDSERARAYAHRFDLHPVMPTFPHVWARVEGLPASRIAVVYGGILAQEGWFFFPFFGSDLRHRVSYVDVETDDRPACQRRGLTRDHPDEHTWLRRIRAFDYVAVQGEPVEAAWIAAHPETFTTDTIDGTMRLYRIRR